MINLYYSEAYWSHSQTMNGPQKVVKNLIQSLNDCDVPYVINEEVYDKTLFVHWSTDMLPFYHNLKDKNNLLVGPQVWAWSNEFYLLKEYNKVILPSRWCEKSLNKFFPQVKTGVWPVAIYPPDIKENIKTDCLVYFKSRPEEDLIKVLNYLDKNKISYTGLQYGRYTQEEFKESLSEVKFCIIIDNTESQGIAIQEMMLVNKPLLVWNQTVWDHMGNDYIVEGTSIPYWSSECGEYFNNFDEFDKIFNLFLSKLDKYNPKKYADRELSPKKSIDTLLKLF
tara:strand:- start:206 stop:1048 length:843 start_codon:yes stop_codon:yes gene_type:complete